MTDEFADCDVEALRAHVRLMAAVINNFPGGISLYDKDLNMVLCNDQQRHLLEYPLELFANGYPSLEKLFRFNAERGEYGKGDVEQLVQERLDLARQRTAHTFERTRPNGTVLEVRGVPLAGGGFVTTYTDVTARRRDQALIEHMAQHDHLTGLPNRMLLRDRLEQAMARAARGEKCALLYLDLDGFKPVNDRLGHAVGDALLKSVAERMRRAIRATDTIARIGGDEFVILQTDIKLPTDCTILAERLQTAIREPYVIDGQHVVIGTTIGIAMAPNDADTADELLRHADEALYLCKAEQRGSFRFFVGPHARVAAE